MASRTARTRTSTTTVSDAHVPDVVDARLTAVLEQLVARRGLHHANLAIMRGDGDRRWSAASGPSSTDDAPIHPSTPFFVASVTKRFIITLVLQAHERGELDLDDAITAYLPAAVTDGLHVRRGVDHTPAITIRHLASHTSGLPDYFDKPLTGPSLYDRLVDGDDLVWDFDEVVRMAREQHRPHFVPQDLSTDRQIARYSDTGFQLLIRILETVTGRGFGDQLQERIVGPLGLEHTWLPGRTRPAAPTPSPSPLHARDRRLELPGMIASSNDLMSTTADLLSFQRSLLAGELFDDPATVQLLTERRNRLRRIVTISYGLGTMYFRVNALAAPGRRPVDLIGHSGSTGTWLFHCPELDLHLAGTVDQAKGHALPFRIMVRLLRAWGADDDR